MFASQVHILTSAHRTVARHGGLRGLISHNSRVSLSALHLPTYQFISSQNGCVIYDVMLAIKGLVLQFLRKENRVLFKTES